MIMYRAEGFLVMSLGCAGVDDNESQCSVCCVQLFYLLCQMQKFLLMVSEWV